jgi:hypothetical protein
MFVYIFEDGTVQQHSRGPTIEDRNAIENGLLLVLYSDSAVLDVDEDLSETPLAECLLKQCENKLGEFHEQA